ncbi:MAG: hypothetical protein WD425_07580 [Nitrospirales bacterium]
MAVSDMKEKAKEVGEQVRDQTSQLAGQAQKKVKSSLEDQKSKRLGELSGLAEAVRQTSQNLREQNNDDVAHYTERAAEQMDRMVDYFDSRNVGELLDDTGMFARRHPEMFLGGAFILGLVAGRFLKSSSERKRDDSTSSGPQESFRNEKPMEAATPTAPTM